MVMGCNPNPLLKWVLATHRYYAIHLLFQLHRNTLIIFYLVFFSRIKIIFNSSMINRRTRECLLSPLVVKIPQKTLYSKKKLRYEVISASHVMMLINYAM